MLHARVADYEPAWCDRLYERREIFEAYNKGLSFVPASEFPWFLGTGRAARGDARRERRGRRTRARADPRGWAALVRRLRAGRAGRRPTGSEHRRTPCAPCSRRTRSRASLGLARREGNRRYYDVIERLLPADVLAHEASARGAAPAQAPVAVPGARPARRERRRRRLQRHRPSEARPALARASWATRAARGARRGGGARRGDGRGRERQALRRPRGGRAPGDARPSRRRRSRSSLPSTRSSGTASSSGACSASTTSGSCSTRPRNDAGAGTCCRSSSETASSAGSSRRIDRGPEPRRRCSTSGGRTASRRAAPKASWTRWETRSAHICASRARNASSGRRTSVAEKRLFTHDALTWASAGSGYNVRPQGRRQIARPRLPYPDARRRAWVTPIPDDRPAGPQHFARRAPSPLGVLSPLRSRAGRPARELCPRAGGGAVS